MRWPRRERKALILITCAFGRDLCRLNHVEMAGRKEKWYDGKTHGTEGLKWQVRNFSRVGGIRMESGSIRMLVTIFGRVADLLKLWNLGFIMKPKSGCSKDLNIEKHAKYS